MKLSVFWALGAATTGANAFAFAPFTPLGSLQPTKKHVPSFFSSNTRLATGVSMTATSVPPKEEKRSPIDAVGSLYLLVASSNLLFTKLSISFPASLSLCGILFSYFLFGPGGSGLYNYYAPAAAFLSKWLPVMFVPSLIALPLAGGLGTRAEVRTKFMHLLSKIAKH
jgi:putative effector of murein hydrolase LrgA (UPF0299 family)